MTTAAKRGREKDKGERAAGGHISLTQGRRKEKERSKKVEGARKSCTHAGRRTESTVGSREFAAALFVMNLRGRCETTRTVRTSLPRAWTVYAEAAESGGVGGGAEQTVVGQKREYVGVAEHRRPLRFLIADK